MMISIVSTKLLKPHPANEVYFDELDEAKYKEIKRSIEANGIRDPIKVLPDYTIISGHQRLKIAQELGMKKVPVLVLDIPAEEAEYLLIAENEERRQSDKDPMKKARRAEFLRKYWGVKHGGMRGNQYAKLPKGQNDLLAKTINDIAEEIGESPITTKRLLKLNDLIPEFQKMVSEGTLSRGAGETLAYLKPEQQKELFDKLGQAIGNLKIEEVRELRRELEFKDVRLENMQRELDRLREELKKGYSASKKIIAEKQKLEEENERLRNHVPDPDSPEAKQIEANLKKLKELENKIKKLEQVKKEKEFEVKDMEMAYERAKKFTSQADIVMKILHKNLDPLAKVMGDLEHNLRYLERDKYNSIVPKLLKLADLMQDIRTILVKNAERLKNAEEQAMREETKIYKDNKDADTGKGKVVSLTNR